VSVDELVQTARQAGAVGDLAAGRRAIAALMAIAKDSKQPDRLDAAEAILQFIPERMRTLCRRAYEGALAMRRGDRRGAQPLLELAMRSIESGTPELRRQAERLVDNVMRIAPPATKA
jgi:hypothetical protein